MTLGADGHRIDLVEARRVFIADDQVGLVAVHRARADQQVVIGRRSQRLIQEHPTLQVVNVIIEHRPQVDDAGDDAGCLVANLDAHALRTGQEVLTLQEVQRTAGAAELFTTG